MRMPRTLGTLGIVAGALLVSGGAEAAEEPPKSPSPTAPKVRVVREAGVGSEIAYARAGVLELGGSGNFTSASDLTQFSLNPSIGWFFMDNLEISGILGVSHVRAQGAEATFLSVLAEPSLHIPLSDLVYGMVGVGVGLSYANGPGTGFALAPRIGTNILIGRSGVFTPQLFLQYSTQEAVATPAGSALAINVSYGAGLGYTVMW